MFEKFVLCSPFSDSLSVPPFLFLLLLLLILVLVLFLLFLLLPLSLSFLVFFFFAFFSFFFFFFNSSSSSSSLVSSLRGASFGVRGIPRVISFASFHSVFARDSRCSPNLWHQITRWQVILRSFLPGPEQWLCSFIIFLREFESISRMGFFLGCVCLCVVSSPSSPRFVSPLTRNTTATLERSVFLIVSLFPPFLPSSVASSLPLLILFSSCVHPQAPFPDFFLYKHIFFINAIFTYSFLPRVHSPGFLHPSSIALPPASSWCLYRSLGRLQRAFLPVSLSGQSPIFRTRGKSLYYTGLQKQFLKRGGESSASPSSVLSRHLHSLRE